MDMDREKFLKIWEFFAWMDRARQELEEDYSDKINRKPVGIKWDGLQPADTVLAHWLTYIFDYRMSAENLWNEVFPIMVHIAYHYSRGDSCRQIIREHVKSVKSKSGNENFEFHAEQSTFKHRFGGTHHLDKCLERTLLRLEAYDRNLVTFMLEKSKDSSDDRWVRDTYCTLYRLTYTNEQKIDYWHKRTWSALRDYLKGCFHRKYVCKALEEYKKKYPDHVLKRWINPEPYLDQLELPGDIWNNEFFEKIKTYVKNIAGKEYRNKSPRAIRDIYDRLKEEAVKRKLYPEQFDVTFNFARMCKNERCQICPLSSMAANTNKLCIGELHHAEEKFCPLLVVVCQYSTLCKPRDCPVFKNITYGLCPSQNR
jgi:hypothetical protein